MNPPEDAKISKVGLLARSCEGHAAKAMQIKDSDLWIEIQNHTFRNWINEHLRPLGFEVHDLSTDFCDGTALIALVEALQKRTLRKIHKPHNQHQMFENVSRALDAIAADGVKLVNIGSEDIVNGNLKLILGLIWSLIVRYQIGQSKFPPKKLMLAWLRSVLPELNVNNFTSDWNSGKTLGALIDYCRPGLCPNWRNMSSLDAEDNCRTTMELAKKELGVPCVLEPEYLANPHLDELSGMTYVSYFMKENGPGYKATMNWIRNQLPQKHISNFTTDWNDGKLLADLVRSYGGPITEELSSDPEQYESNLAVAIKGGEKLGVTPILRAKDMADPAVDHLGIMSYTAAYQWLPKRPPPGDRVSVTWETKKFRRGCPVTFIIDCHEDELDSREIVIEVKGPSGKVDCRLSQQSNHVTKGIFTATEIGIHEVVVKYMGETVRNSPLKCRVLPPVVTSRQIVPANYNGLEPCAVGSVVEVLVNPQDSSPAGARQEFMEVLAISPSGNTKPCTVNKVPGGFAATFKPDEAGEWKVTVMYKGKDIQGSPFPCFSFDPNGIKLDSLEGAMPGLPFSFICDSRGTGGQGEVDIDVTYEKRSIPYDTEYISDGLKRILLPVLNGGKHRVHVYFNGHEIRGSPFPLRVGYSRSRRRQEDNNEYSSNTKFQLATPPKIKLSSEPVQSPFGKTSRTFGREYNSRESKNSQFSHLKNINDLKEKDGPKNQNPNNFKANNTNNYTSSTIDTSFNRKATSSLFKTNSNSNLDSDTNSNSNLRYKASSPLDLSVQEFDSSIMDVTRSHSPRFFNNNFNTSSTVYNNNSSSITGSSENIYETRSTIKSQTSKYLVTDSSFVNTGNGINARNTAFQQQYFMQLT